MTVRRPNHGFGIVETLMTMALVGVILGIVARGYQAMSRLNLASYQMSQRMELSAFLQRLSYEVTSALAVTTGPNTFRFQRIDPTLNLNYKQASPARLPWPISPLITSSNLLDPIFQVSVVYTFVPAEFRIERTSFGATSNEVVGIGEFSAALEPGGRILTIAVRPQEMTAESKARIFLPVVTP